MMYIKILKMALAGFVLSMSGFANAGLITMLITDNGTDLTMTATGDYDNTGLTNLGAIQVGVKAFVFSNYQDIHVNYFFLFRTRVEGLIKSIVKQAT
jgi:hypothetical protein